jgi:hypothetical protein
MNIKAIKSPFLVFIVLLYSVPCESAPAISDNATSEAQPSAVSSSAVINNNQTTRAYIVGNPVGHPIWSFPSKKNLFGTCAVIAYSVTIMYLTSRYC